MDKNNNAQFLLKYLLNVIRTAQTWAIFMYRVHKCHETKDHYFILFVPFLQIAHNNSIQYCRATYPAARHGK